MTPTRKDGEARVSDGELNGYIKRHPKDTHIGDLARDLDDARSQLAALSRHYDKRFDDLDRLAAENAQLRSDLARQNATIKAMGEAAERERKMRDLLNGALLSANSLQGCARTICIDFDDLDEAEKFFDMLESIGAAAKAEGEKGKQPRSD